MNGSWDEFSFMKISEFVDVAEWQCSSVNRLLLAKLEVTRKVKFDLKLVTENIKDKGKPGRNGSAIASPVITIFGSANVHKLCFENLS